MCDTCDRGATGFTWNKPRAGAVGRVMAVINVHGKQEQVVASSRPTGKTQAMLEQAAAASVRGRVFVVGIDPQHADHLRERLDGLGAKSVTVIALIGIVGGILAWAML